MDAKKTYMGMYIYIYTERRRKRDRQKDTTNTGYQQQQRWTKKNTKAEIKQEACNERTDHKTKNQDNARLTEIKEKQTNTTHV